MHRVAHLEAVGRLAGGGDGEALFQFTQLVEESRHLLRVRREAGECGDNPFALLLRQRNRRASRLADGDLIDLARIEGDERVLGVIGGVVAAGESQDRGKADLCGQETAKDECSALHGVMLPELLEWRY